MTGEGNAALSPERPPRRPPQERPVPEGPAPEGPAPQGSAPERPAAAHPVGTRHVVVMGVSGCGKTTVALGIAERTGLLFAEADDFHSRANVEKMRAGIPLDDTDRWPWLRDLARWMAERAAEGRSTVIACSALKRSYRDVLADGPPSIDFVHLDGPAAVIRARLSQREGHYMPASLLDSQIATLEPLDAAEPGIVLDVTRPPDELVGQAISRLGLPDELGDSVNR